MSKVYEIITERIIGMMERGVIPWRRPWEDLRATDGHRPANYGTDRAYTGMNRFMLSAYSMELPGAARFLTFKQAKQLGGMVKKGEHGFPVVYWHWFGESKKPKEGEPANKARMRAAPLYYTVFHWSQCEGIEAPTIEVPEERSAFATIEACEHAVANMPNAPRIIESIDNRACYRPMQDVVEMPRRSQWDSATDYYATLAHELVHSTGHKSRLGRVEKWGSFGSEPYSREELCAELGAAFICADLGISAPDLEERHASYIKNWCAYLKEHTRDLLIASGQASKAARYILNQQESEKEMVGA